MENLEEVTLYWPKGLFFWGPKVVYAKGFMLGEKRHGRWTFWDKNGERQLEGEYVRDKKVGLWIKWNQNGIKTTEGEFLHGKMHGRWIDWHNNGKKALESHWIMGKRDGEWKYWNTQESLEKIIQYDQTIEEDKGYSIYTDLETKQLIRDIQKHRLHGVWERLVGKSVAKFVKPWHVACWMLLFVPLLGLIKDKTPWRSAILAALLAFLFTGFLAWSLESKTRNR